MEMQSRQLPQTKHQTKLSDETSIKCAQKYLDAHCKTRIQPPILVQKIRKWNTTSATSWNSTWEIYTANMHMPIMPGNYDIKQIWHRIQRNMITTPTPSRRNKRTRRTDQNDNRHQSQKAKNTNQTTKRTKTPQKNPQRPKTDTTTKK